MSSSDSPRSEAEQSRPRKRQRIARACDRCKAKKTKCDARQPSCSRCNTLEAECVYGEIVKRGKGRTLKAHVQSLEERLARMEALLVANVSSSHGDIPGEDAVSLPVSSVDANVNMSDRSKESPTNDDACESSVPAATASSLSLTANHTANDGSLLSSLPPSLPGSHITQDYIDHIQNNSNQRLPRMQTFTPMPPTVEIFTIVEIYLDEVNTFLPIFHPQSLRLLCQRGATSERPDPLWWACINVILATTTQSRSTDSGFSKVSGFSWGFFKNAFSVYDNIITSEPSILGLQVLLVMVTFVARTSDLKLALLLSSTCVHMARALGLNKKLETSSNSRVEVQQRMRLIWITFIVDSVLRTKAGQPLVLSAEDIEVDVPERSPADRLGCYEIPGTNQTVNVVNLMIQITVIRASVYNYLRTSTEMLHSTTTQNYIASVQCQISDWTEALPIDYRPEGTSMALDLSILVLHLAYYDCVGLVCTLIHKFAGLQQLIASESAEPSSLRPEVVDTRKQRAHLGRSVLDLCRSCNAIPFVYLWIPLQDMLAATIELTSNVLDCPDSEHVLTNLRAISSFVRFLKHLKYDKGCDVTHLLKGCITMEQAAKCAVLEEPNADAGAIQSLFAYCPENRLLAQALMTNLPKLDAACEAAATNVFVQSEHRMLGPLLAPECLTPSLYNFGSDPETTNVVNIMRAVYSDVEA